MPVEPKAGRIPSPEENSQAKQALRDLLNKAELSAREGRAALGVLIGNGMAHVLLDEVKPMLAECHREASRQVFPWTKRFLRCLKDVKRTGLRRGFRRPKKYDDLEEVYNKAWKVFERERVLTWLARPPVISAHALLFQWIGDGLLRLIISSNYDLHIESLFLRTSHPALSRSFVLNPVLTPWDQDRCAGLYAAAPSQGLVADGPVHFFKYGGTFAFATLESRDWRYHIRLGANETERLRQRYGDVVESTMINKILEPLCSAQNPPSLSPSHPFDLRTGPFGHLHHHVDWITKGCDFLRERDGALRFVERHWDQLDGFVVFGNWGQPGELLNEALCEMANKKPVVQVLWYPPSKKDFERDRPGPSLWQALQSTRYGSRLLLTPPLGRVSGDATKDLAIIDTPLEQIIKGTEEETAKFCMDVFADSEIREIGRFHHGSADIDAIAEMIECSSLWIDREEIDSSTLLEAPDYNEHLARLLELGARRHNDSRP